MRESNKVQIGSNILLTVCGSVLAVPAHEFTYG
jgi:hypothetical protein